MGVRGAIDGAGGGAVDAAVGGAEGARGAFEGGVPTSGFVELGRFVHASSSNPLTTGIAELERTGGWTGVNG